MQTHLRVGPSPTAGDARGDHAALFAAALGRAEAAALPGELGADLAGADSVVLRGSANGLIVGADRLIAARLTPPDLPWDAPRG